MALAIFDLDNTLLADDSDHLWGEFLVEKNIVDAHVYKKANERFYQDYKEGNLDINAFCQFVFKVLKDNDYQQLIQWRSEFLQTKIQPKIALKAPVLIQKHKNQGDTLLIITATNLFITAPIAKLLGIDAILATTPEFDGKQFTGKLEGIPCFKEGKVERLNSWLKDNKHNLKGSYFYSDSHNDLPLLEIVDSPIVVDGDEKLLIVAKKHGWKSISLRS